MASDEEHKSNSGGKGFAGLSSLVSDVDTAVIGVGKSAPKISAEPSETEHTNSGPRPKCGGTEPGRQPYQEPPQPSGGSSGGKWLLGIGAMVGLIWLVSQSGNSGNNSYPPPAYSPSTPSSTGAAPTPSAQYPSAGDQSPVAVFEEEPPVGTNNTLTTTQIRYCLAEDIRLEAAKLAINNFIGADVDRFNRLVADYNSRCSQFRYRRGALESARADVESRRALLMTEGRGRFISSPKIGAVESSATSSLPQSVPIESAQRTTEGGNAGSPQLSSEERDSIELACIIEKSNGPASYNSCLQSQLAQLMVGPRRPDFSRLSSSERDSIELACILEKSNGPASYNSCLQSQLAQLMAGPRRPDLSRLSSSERDSIELACILQKSNGPASYNSCLTSQISSLRR